MSGSRRPPSLAELVRARRDERGLTQAAMAEAVGMSQEWISKLERGQIVQPHAGTMQRIADVLALDVLDLYIASNVARTREEARRIQRELATAAEIWKPRGEWTPRDAAIAELGRLARRMDAADLEGVLVLARRLVNPPLAGR